ncbi:MAG: transcription termination factor Rho [Clostridiales bacterium]|nr:transcription termination factor Rho [Clostridiales bacterium]
MQENWKEKSLLELRTAAKEKGLKGISTLRKQELIDLLTSEVAEEISSEKQNSETMEYRKSMGYGDRNRSRNDRNENGGENRRPSSVTYNRNYRNNNVKNFGGAGGQMKRGNLNREEGNVSYRNTGNRRYGNNPEGSENRRYGNNAEGNENHRFGNSQDSAENRRCETIQDGEENRRYGNESACSNRRYNPENSDMYQNSEEKTESVRLDGWNTGSRSEGASIEEMKSLDSGVTAYGILDVMADGYGFIRSGTNYMPGDNDIYVSPSQIRRFNMKTGDMISGSVRIKTGQEKFAALLYINEINGDIPSAAENRRNFEDMTPVFPDERLHLETPGGSCAMRIVDLLSPIGKGQRGMIVSPPKAGKTTLLKEIASAVQKNHPEIQMIILLIDERPEEVTDIKESIQGDKVEVIYSTFDEQPEHHKKVAEMVLGRAKCLVEQGNDVIVLLDSITRLARAYNLTVAPSGRTLSGGLDPAALHMPKKFFGAARNMREGGSLTVLATALVDTGSRMDDVVFEEFKGTGNMELVLDRKLSERRVFPAIDIQRSGTRRDDLLLTDEEKEAVDIVRRGLNGMKADDSVEQILNMFAKTMNNKEFVEMAKKIRL